MEARDPRGAQPYPTFSFHHTTITSLNDFGESFSNLAGGVTTKKDPFG
jgi:hypothetical protein